MDDTRIIEHGGRRWSVRPAAEPLLADGWPPDQPERLRLVKRGHRRTVSRLEVGGAGFFLKEYEPRGLVGRVLAALGMSPARREWQALAAAREAGLDVPEPIALALGPREALLTREIAGAQRLDEHLFERYFEPLAGDPPYPGARPPELVAVYRRRRRPPEGTIDPSGLARALADLITGMIRAGIAFHDFHPGNILISGGPAAWRLSLVDLADAEVGAGPEEIGFTCLVQLEHFFEPIASVAERLRCLKHLEQNLRAFGRPGWTVADARHLARVAARYRQSFYRHRDHRVRRESKYFRRVAASPWRGWATGDWAAAVEAWLAAAVEKSRAGAGEGQGGLGNLAELLGPDTEVLKAGGSSTVVRARLGTADAGASGGGSDPAAADRRLIVKRDHRAGRRGAAGRLLGASRSVAAFRTGHALLARGIATARPAAAIDVVRHGKVLDTLLMTEAVDDALPLAAWLRGSPAPALRRRVTWRLARLIRRLHDAGLVDRDLKAPNILIAGATGPDPRPVLVDLDGVRRAWAVSPRRRARDLMRLSVSLDEWGVARRTDRLRFLRIYLGRPGCPGPIAILHRRRGVVRGARAARRLRRWWRRIARLSARKMETLRRKARP